MRYIEPPIGFKAKFGLALNFKLASDDYFEIGSKFDQSDQISLNIILVFFILIRYIQIQHQSFVYVLLPLRCFWCWPTRVCIAVGNIDDACTAQSKTYRGAYTPTTTQGYDYVVANVHHRES